MNDLFGMEDGSILQTHSAEVCKDGPCCVHQPSDHPLKNAPLFWESGKRRMMRICSCGIYHPDPDHLSFVALHSMIIAVLHGMHECCAEECCTE